MRAFLLGLLISLLAGWCVHWRLQQAMLVTVGSRPSVAEEKRSSRPVERRAAAAPDMDADITESEFPAMVAAAVEQCPTEGDEWRATILPLWRRWALFDPEAALEHLESVKSRFPRLRDFAVKDTILAVWASHDAKGAAAWFQSRVLPGLKHLDSRSDYPSALVETLALRDFQAAFSLVVSFYGKPSPGELKTNSVSIGNSAFFAAAIEEANLSSFLRSLRSITRDDVRGQLCGELIGYMLHAQIANRKAIIGQLPIPDRWPPGILCPWASLAWDEVHEASDPQKAADTYVAKLRAEDPGRGLVLEWIIDAWAPRDAEAAGQWLTKWDGVPEANRARATYAREAAQTDPLAAFEWANDFCEPRDRAHLAQEAYVQWHRRDPDEANQWLMDQALPPALVSRLLGEGKSR